MSHCEVVCDRVAVLEDGKIEIMGNTLQMNRKFGHSFVIKLKVPPERRFDIAFLKQLFDVMQEEFHQCALSYLYKVTFLIKKPGRRSIRRDWDGYTSPGGFCVRRSL